MRVLAGSWRAPLAFVLLRLRSCADFTFCGRAQRARSLPLVRVSSELLWRMCRSPPLAECTRSAGLLLSCRQRTNRKTGDPHGCRARTPQDGKRMHDDRGRAGLVFHFASNERASRTSARESKLDLRRRRENL